MTADQNIADVAVSMAGLKAQFVDYGWTEAGAEQKTIELFGKLAQAGAV